MLFILALLAACGGADIDNKEAVRQGVISHLSSQSTLNLDSMDIELTSVVFRDNEADATVAFQAKGNTDPAAGMQMRYTLERQGNRWVVKEKAGAGDSGHGMDPHGSTGGGSPGAMPPGHPPVTPPEDGKN